jgi:hypothetical protein
MNKEDRKCTKCKAVQPLACYPDGTRYCAGCRVGMSPLSRKRGTLTPNGYRVDGEIAYIQLTDERNNLLAEAIVDEADVAAVIAFGRWKIAKRHATKYVTMGKRTPEGMKQIYLHRFLMGPTGCMEVDHINRDGLDNRRANLRVVTRNVNLANRHLGEKKPGSSGIPGVCRVTRKGIFRGWSAFLLPLMNNGKRLYIGEFSTIEEAAAAIENAQAERTA